MALLSSRRKGASRVLEYIKNPSVTKSNNIKVFLVTERVIGLKVLRRTVKLFLGHKIITHRGAP